MSGWRNKLQRRLQAQQNRSWEFDKEEGILDAGRWPGWWRTPPRPCPSSGRKTPSSRYGGDLLLDNSGSMRGRPISIAAICATCGADAGAVQREGEILGFTTRAWKGGQSRERWLAQGRPQMPGRLKRLAAHHLQVGGCAVAAGAGRTLG